MCRRCLWLAAGLGLLFGLDSCRDSSSDGRRVLKTIAVVPKGTTHMFWKSIEAGARAAGRDLGMKIVWKGPLTENDRARQIAILEQFVMEQVAGIVLAPLDDTALVRPVRIAKEKKIPVVIIDSGLKGRVGEDFISFVATDNHAGGRLAGQRMVELLGGRGKVVLLRYQVGSASTTRREAGFLEVVGQHREIELLVDNQYGGATAGETIQKGEELLDQLRRADGLFCPNESTTYGMLVTLRKNQLAGAIKFVGFDSSPALIEAMENGEIDSLVVQNPRRMGYEGVKTLVHYLREQVVPRRIDTGVALVTHQNMGDPEIRELISPE